MSMRSYVEASHHLKRGTTAGQNSVREISSRWERGLMRTLYEIPCKPKRGDQRITTSMLLNCMASHEQTIPECTTPLGYLKALVDGRVQVPKMCHITIVSWSLTYYCYYYCYYTYLFIFIYLFDFFKRQNGYKCVFVKLEQDNANIVKNNIDGKYALTCIA